MSNSLGLDGSGRLRRIQQVHEKGIKDDHRHGHG